MSRHTALASLLVAAAMLSPASSAQTPRRAPPTRRQQQQQQSPPQQQQNERDDDEVVRITTNLVQVDAVVTDRGGRQVTDLAAGDFELLQDGRPQQITNFSYVRNGPPEEPRQEVARANPAEDSLRPAAAVPPARLRPESVRRTVALVVDDLGLSAESVVLVKRALRKYVDEQMLPGDLAALVRTRAGSGALQQFTPDKRLLHAAIGSVRWFPNGRGGLIPVGESNALDDIAAAMDVSTGTDAAISNRNREREDPNKLRETAFTVGTLGAVNHVIGGLRDLPGRKALVLFSDGFRLFDRVSGAAESNERIQRSLRRLIDQANRASVVIYTVDARGLQPLGGTDFNDTQEGLNYLARETGGLAIRNANDLSGGVERVLRDQSGYYLIGYRPDERSFDPETGRPAYKNLKIRVKDRSGLTVRTRSDFYGVADDAPRAQAPAAPAGQLRAALLSPFGAGGLSLRLTSIYGDEGRTGPFVRSLLHVAADNITFADEAGGWKRAVLDVIAVTSDEQGRIVEQVEGTRTVRVRAGEYARLLRDGLISSFEVPLKRPGAYQLRVAVRDQASARVGAASQFIEVPDLAKNRLTLSGLVVSGPAAGGGAQQPATQNGAAGEETLNAQSGPAVRRFRQGSFLDYGFVIYNARADRPTGLPKLRMQLFIFRDGRQVYAGQAQAPPLSGPANAKRYEVGGRLQLGSELPPGEYFLQIVVVDDLADRRHRAAVQSTDFEIAGR